MSEAQSEHPEETTREKLTRVLNGTMKGLEKKLADYRSERLVLDGKIDDVSGTINEIKETIRRLS